MARASVKTKLSLDTWAKILGINPLHFNQVYIDPVTLCGQPVLQYAWQDVDRIGREDIAQAIAQAEADIESRLGYRLAPSWEVDEWQATIRPNRPELENLNSRDVRGFSQVAFVNWGHFITGGIETKTLIQAAVSITYTDPDSDGYKELATITVPVSITNSCEIAIYYPGENGSNAWEIRPINVSISGGIATIKARREQFVKKEILEKIAGDQLGVDGAVDTNFLSTVDVYRHYNDPQLQVQLLWEPMGCSSCDGSGCPSCSYSVQNGCLMIRGNPRNSIIVYRPAKWNSITLDFDTQDLSQGREPDLTRVWYYAGLRDKSLICPLLEMPKEWAFAVAVYAAALLDRPICSCSNTKEFIDRWQVDLAVENNAFRHKISDRDLGNPFGTRAGAIYAWGKISKAARLEPVFA